MAKKVLLDTYYTFTPSSNTVVIPRVIQRENLMLITNVTTNQVIYNFSDPDLNALSYTVRGSSTNSTTTIVLNYDCANALMKSTDKLQVIYDEYDEKITPSDNLVDAVAKMRVAAPQSLIDTDFEYGVQGSKWEALTLTHNYASFFSKGSGGNSLEVLDMVSSGGSDARVKSTIAVATNAAHGLATNDVVSVQETTNNNAEGTFAVTVPAALSLTVATTDIFTTGSSSIPHGFILNQPIIFSNVGASGAVGVSNDTIYYVSFTGVTNTTYEFKVSTTINGSAVDITTASSSAFLTDNTKMFSYKAIARVTSGSIKDGNLTTIVPGGIFDNAHIPGGVKGNLDSFQVFQSATGTNAITTIQTSEPHGLIPGTPILINGVTSIGISSITNKQIISNQAVLTTADPHNLIVGETVVISGVDSTFNGRYVTVTGTTGNTIMYAKTGTQASAAVTPAGTAVNLGLIGTDGAASADLNGSWIVSGVESPRRFSFVRTGTLTKLPSNGTVNSEALLICKPDSYIQHTSANGGVQLSTVNNVTGIQQIRQTRKTFRYQSGKAIQFSTGAKFTPSYDIQSIGSDVSSGSATVIVVTVQDHGMQPGARVKVEGIQVVGGDFNPFNGDFLVTDVINQNTFAYKTTITPGFTYTTNMNPSGENSVVTVSTWAGACTRVGLFNEMNGIFFEYDGQKLWVCKRASNKPLYGSASVTLKSNTVTGTDTRFTKQLVSGDNIVLKGQVYKVLFVESDSVIKISPAYRGQTVSSGVKVYKVQTTRIPQNEFNLDRLDGTGPSGYILDPTKMQMVYIDYTWYGSGFIRFGMRMTNGDVMYCHRMPNNNVNTQSYMRSGNLPARYEVNNYAPRTRLIAGSTSTTGVPSSSDASGASLPSTGTVMYVEDITGWRTSPASGIDGDIIGYALIEKGGENSQSELVGYTKVGAYNSVVGGYPISMFNGTTATRARTQPLIIGSSDGIGNLTTQINSTTITGSGFTGLEAGDILYTDTGVKLGVVASAPGTDTSVTVLTAPPANPIPAPSGASQGYTQIAYKVVKVRALTAGDSLAQTFLPDSSIAGALYQKIDNVTVTAGSAGPPVVASVFTSPSAMNARITAGTKVEVVSKGATNLVESQTYYVATPYSPGSTTFGLSSSAGGAAEVFTAGTVNLVFAAREQVSVKVITQTCAPSLTHWGSSVIMDGGYDEDRGIQFNTRMKRYLSIAANASRPVLSLRIAPSVDNGIGRNFGKREVVNTMQLVLKQIEALGTGPFLVEGILNPTSFSDSAVATSVNYPACWETFNIGSGSLAQVIFHDNTGILGSGGATYTPVTATGQYSGGDTIFSFYTDNSGGSSNPSVTRFDLQEIREMGTSILSGNGSVDTPGFPNGPDVLTIVVTNLSSLSPANLNLRLSWSEAQA